MSLCMENKVKACEELLIEFERRKTPIQAEKLIFSDVGDNRDVYNITAPFQDKGEAVIAGRVERRETEHSEIVFFVNRDGVWIPRENTRTFCMQDPFFTMIGNELILGGVEVEFEPDHKEKVKSWRTLFYRGSDIEHLVYFAVGPKNMKDIRLTQLPNGKIGVFTRPLLVGDARALIGYTEIDDLKDLNAEKIETAHLFMDQFRKDEWGGANETHLLSNGLIGVLGHIAYTKDGIVRHYHAMTFIYDPQTGRKSSIKIIAVRGQFPEGPAKRLDISDVIFSGGMQRLGSGKAMLYAGISDAEAHRMLIDDPFTEYEMI